MIPDLATALRSQRHWYLHVPGVCRSINREREGEWSNWAVELRETRERWRDEAQAAQLPRLVRVHIVAQPFAPSEFGRHHDTGNDYPSVKAAIDGLVNARVIPDDSGDHVLSLLMLPPQTGAAALGLTIIEVP